MTNSQIPNYWTIYYYYIYIYINEYLYIYIYISVPNLRHSGAVVELTERRRTHNEADRR